MSAKREVRNESDPARVKRSDIKMFKSILAIIASNLASNGETDLSPMRLLQEYVAVSDSAQGLSDERQIVIDHTQDLLRHARDFGRNGSAEIACVFYATWIEHRLNGYCSIIAARKRVSAADTEQLIRGTSLQAKLSLLQVVLGHGFSRHVRVIIVKLSELRNAYVHYKWKPAPEQLEAEYRRSVADAERVVRHLQHFERKYLGHISQRRAVALARAASAKVSPSRGTKRGANR